jgi:hypothetical protein
MTQEAEFKVTINPFLQTMTVEGSLHNLIKDEVELTYNEIDEWNSFEMFGYKYDIHFLYDTRPEVSIYEIQEFVDDNYTERSERKVTLIIKI